MGGGGYEVVVVAAFGVGAFDDLVGHGGGGGHLFGEFLFGVDDGVVDHVVTFDFDDGVGAVGLLDEEVGVVGADGVRVGVDVLDEEVGLAVG